MTHSFQVENILVEYNDSTGDTTANGKKTDRFKPMFIPNGNEEPDFFGVVDLRTSITYDIFGNKSKISQESQIKI